MASSDLCDDRDDSEVHLPSVVFCVEEEVGADNGDADGHDGQDQEHQQHEPVHVVDLVGPERGEDEVPGWKRKY